MYRQWPLETLGALVAHYPPFDYFLAHFAEAYSQCKRTERFPRALLLETRGWMMTLAELREVTVILSLPPHLPPGSPKPNVASKAQYPTLPENVDDAAKYLDLGEIVGYRPFPFPSVAIPVGLEWDMDGVYRLAVEWASTLAREHIARTNPTFEQARLRMMDAYSKLFELEQTLRSFVQQQLEAKHGPAWWDKIHPNTKTKVARREADPTKQWFDDYSPSRFKFADFDDLRLAVVSNWQDFTAIVGDRDLFISNMMYLSHARDRVAHVNTFSRDDHQEFLTQANRLLDIIRPHVVLP